MKTVTAAKDMKIATAASERSDKFDNPQTPPHMEGGDTIRSFWRSVMGVLKRRDLKDLWVRAVDEPGWVLARFKGDMLTLDGRTYRNSYNNLLRIRDGKIVEYYE